MSVTAEQLAKARSDEELAKLYLSKFNEMFNRCAQSRISYDRTWYTNMAFFFGKQWVEWVGNTTSSDGMRLYEPPAPRHRVRMVSNKIRPIVRKELTKLTKEETEAFVMPSSKDESDLAAARAAEQLSEYLFDKLGFRKIRRMATFWASLQGSGFTKQYWDPSKIDIATGMPGDLVLEAFSSFGMYVPNLQVEELESQPYLFHAVAKAVEWVEDTYKIKVHPDTKLSGAPLEQRLLNSLGINSQSSEDNVYVREMWIKPCRTFPNGGMVTFSKENLLTPIEAIKEMTYPFSHMQYPFAKIDHIPSGRFFGSSVIEDLIPLQKEYNRGRSQLMEARNRMAKPQLAAPKGSIDANKITSEPGLVIFYTPGFQPPTPIPLASIPSYVMQELDRTERDMDGQAAQYEGGVRPPPGVEAASAIAYLQEENDTQLNHTIESIEEAAQKIGNHLLILANDYWDDPRKISVVGVEGTYEIMELSSKDLRGNTDFRIVPGSAIPKSRAAKLAQIMELVKLGIVDGNKALKYMNMPETRHLYESYMTTKRQVEREHLKMKKMFEEFQQNAALMQGVMMPGMEQQQQQPEILPVNTFDDNDGHIEHHAEYCRSQEFEMLDPTLQAMHIAHLQMHQLQRSFDYNPAGGTSPTDQGQSEQPEAQMMEMQ